MIYCCMLRSLRKFLTPDRKRTKTEEDRAESCDSMSFLAARVGIADVALRATNYLMDVETAAGTIDDDIEGLTDEIERLMTV